jgi:TIR domain
VPDIFISYRREDTSGYAGRIYDQISAHFGKDHVFMDVADLEPGSDFVDTIEKKVATCDALIALIGKNWLTIKDEQNQVRLSRPGDFVSVEIAAALKRNVEVIPVLVGGAKMPVEQQLPESVRLLSRRQALEISDVHFTRDIGDLIEALTRPDGPRPAYSHNRTKPALAASIFTICALAAGLGIWTWQRSRLSRHSVEAPQGASNSAIQNDTAATANSSISVPNAKLSGNWLAVVQKEDVTYEIYLTFEVVGNKLFGKAVYPTGEAGILNGTIDQGKLSFTTKHVPDFSDEEATITVEGRVSGDEIEVFTQDKDGYSKGRAHRVSRISTPKVLARPPR